MAGGFAIGTPVSPGHLVGTGKVSFAPKGAGRVACESHKTLSALGRWFGFELDKIFGIIRLTNHGVSGRATLAAADIVSASLVSFFEGLLARGVRSKPLAVPSNGDAVHPASLLARWTLTAMDHGLVQVPAFEDPERHY